jgi:hypothetical protein
MDVSSGSTIPAFRRHVTLLCWKCYSSEKLLQQLEEMNEFALENSFEEDS